MSVGLTGMKTRVNAQALTPGGMCDSKPYVLLNCEDNINWLFTLVHELGHGAPPLVSH